MYSNVVQVPNSSIQPILLMNNGCQCVFFRAHALISDMALRATQIIQREHILTLSEDAVFNKGRAEEAASPASRNISTHSMPA